MDNPGKKKGKQKVCFKLPQKKRPHQLPTHPQTSIGRFSRQFEYGSGPLYLKKQHFVLPLHAGGATADCSRRVHQLTPNTTLPISL